MFQWRCFRVFLLRFPIVSLVLVLAATGAPAMPSSPSASDPCQTLGTFTIGGLVYDAARGPSRPVAGATVSVVHLTCASVPSSGSTVADAVGRFVFAVDLHALDAVVLEVRAPGFHPTTVHLSGYEVGRSVAAEVGLLPRSGLLHRVEGRVRGSGVCPVGLSGATIVLEPVGRRTTVSADGTFTFNDVEDGDYAVWADVLLGRAPPSKMLRIAGEDARVDLCGGYCQTRPLVRPSSASPGAIVELHGQCYNLHSGGAGIVYFDERLVTTVRGETGGDYAGEITIPSDATPGVHVIRVVNGRVVGSAPITVSGAAATCGGGCTPAAPLTSMAAARGPLNPFALADVDGMLYFAGEAPGSGHELWRSDGTESGTTLVADVLPGSASSSPREITNWNGSLAFVADTEGYGLALWRSDGTPQGTVQLQDSLPGFDLPDPSDLRSVGSLLYFATYPATVWRTDGTPGGTARLADVEPDATVFYLDVRTLFATPTQVLINVFAQTECCDVYRVLVGDPVRAEPIFFTAGTQPPSIDLQPAQFSMLNDMVVFRSGLEVRGTNGRETWRIFDRFYIDDVLQSVGDLAVVGDTLYFAVASSGSSRGLWRSNGSSSDASQVASFASAAHLSLLTAAGNGLFFVVADERHGSELWHSDGTPEGTQLLKDIVAGSGSSFPSNLTAVDGLLLFTVAGRAGGADLWLSDGTASGTVRIQELPGSDPSSMTVSGDHVFFTLTAAPGGNTLWDVPRSALHATRAVPCPGDCDGDGVVGVDELVRGVGMLLGGLDCSACAAAFCNAACGPGPSTCRPRIDCLVRAVRGALDGCPVDGCQRDADCDDGNECSTDRCTAAGCVSACLCV